MSYHYVYLLDARLPSEHVEAWLNTPLDAVDTTRLAERDLADWGMEPSGSCDCVRDVFDNLRSWADAAEVELGAEIRAVALADKSGDAWLSLRGDLVIAVMALAAHGGKGRLDITGFVDGPDDAFRVDVDGAKVAIHALKEADGQRIKDGPAFLSLMQLLEGGALPAETVATSAPRPPPQNLERILDDSARAMTANDPRRAYALLRPIIDAQHHDPRVWANMMYCYNALGAEDDPAFESDVELLETLIDTDRAFASVGPLIENFSIVCGNTGRADLAIAAVEKWFAAKKADAWHEDNLAGLLQSFTWAGAQMTDKTLLERVRKVFETVYAAQSDAVHAQPGALDNMVAVYGKLGDRRALFATLQRLKALDYAGLAALRTDPLLAGWHKDPEFVAFFKG